MALQARPFEVVVWGATGFTGKLVCQHIARDYQGLVKWAIAGRDQSKLERVRADLMKINKDCGDISILVADAFDGPAIGKVLSQTKVVIAMAGPYSMYGEKVLEQCIEQGTHYCDITGEMPFVKKDFLKHNKIAQEKGIKLVHSCAYDSVPSDLGTFMMVDYIKKQLGKKTAKVMTLVGDSKGGVSGGTIASGMLMSQPEYLSESTASGTDAYYLARLAGGRGSDKPAPLAATFIKQADSWAGPFVMEGVNSRIVHLSNALAKESYGKDFKYLEMVKTGDGWSGWSKAVGITSAMVAIGLVFTVSALKDFALRYLPAPGEGPSEEMQKTGYWTHELLAETEEAPGQAPTLVQGTCGDRRDAGYWGSSRLVLEVGLCLALDADKVEANGCPKGGVLTPAAALGMVLVERLRAAGMTWEVTKVGGKAVKNS